MKKFIYSIFPLLGFSAVSCDGIESGGNLDAYGVPYNEYRVSARVVDPEGNPIEGIEVSVNYGFGNEPIDRSNSEGCFEVQFYEGIRTLHLKDVDGGENGGEFIARDVEVGDYQSEGRNFRADLGDIELERKTSN